MNVKLIIGVFMAWVGMIFVTTGAQLGAMFQLTQVEARVNAVLNASVLGTLLLVPIVIAQFHRKHHLLIYGKISAICMIVGVFYQFLGAGIMEIQPLLTNAAMILLVMGIVICYASCFYGLFGHRLRFFF